MNCKHAFEDMFIIQKINRTFFQNELKKKQTDILVQIEKSRIPQTQEPAKQLVYKENYNKIKKEVSTNIKRLRKEYLSQLRQLKQTFDTNVAELMATIPPQNKPVTSEKTFNIRCQYDCKGFLSTSYKCGICDKYTCSKCFEGLGLHNTLHVCDADKVETIKMIKRETRSCPVCSTRISKIEGCDQMWCTNCNNAFSWKTGLVQTGAIHNPHYFEYLKKQTGSQPRNPLDVQCGGIPEHILLHTRPFRHLKNVQIIEKNLYNILRFCIHIQNTRIPYNLNHELEQIRIQYILNRISDEKWRQKIYLCHDMSKKKQFEWDMQDIILNVGSDLLRNYDKVASEIGLDELYEYVLNVTVKEFLEIINYVNELKMNKAKIYKHKAHVVRMLAGEDIYIKNTFTYIIVDYDEKTIDPL
jgi:hypothetical protein